MKILITDGAGYVGSHKLVAVIRACHEVLVMESLVRGQEASRIGVGELTY